MLVNTCAFIDAAKQESIAELLSAAAGGARVVAAGCLAERYGSQLAEALPEAQILSFDDYGDIAARLDAVLAGERRPAHEPRDRRRLLPLAPAGPARRAPPARPGPRPCRAPGSAIADLPPGTAPASGPRVCGAGWTAGPVAPLKIASGCDRRCSFCAIPAFRGAFLSRPPQDVIAERVAGRPGRGRAAAGQRELHVLRQGPGQAALLDELLVAPGGGAGDRPGPGELPAARRGPARPGHGDDLHPWRRALLRPVVPARQRPCCGRCAGSGTPTGSARCSTRSGRRARMRASGPTSSWDFPVRRPRTWPSSSGSCRWPAWTRSASSATPTRRGPRPPRCPGRWTRRRSPAGPMSCRISPKRSWPSGPPTASATPSRCSSRRPGRRPMRAGRPTRRPRWTG